MDNWYKVVISRQNFIEGKHISLVLEFNNLYLANRTPKGAALFAHHWHDFPINYFFSPGAALFTNRLIAYFGGIECAAPLASEVSISVGDERLLSKIPFAV